MNLAKLTPPSTARLLPRPRLFERLDAARSQQLIWITAPAGSGKTALASSWLADRVPEALWLRLDGDDSEPATFFHYLARCAQRPGKPLPVLAGEQEQGLRTYTRRFSRHLGESLSPHFILALDDYHKLRADSPLHGLIAILAEELPASAALVILSRFAPPAALRRTFARGSLLDADALRFTPEETRRLVAVHGGGDSKAIQAATQGWAAGIVLMAQAVGKDVQAPQSVPQAVYDFIASEFFDPLDGETRDFLLHVGLLPQVTEDLCKSLGGGSGGTRWLAELAQGQIFAHPHPDAAGTYVFQPLFRSFLGWHIDTRLDAEARALLLQRVARTLEQAGEICGAAEVWIRAGAWAELTRLLHTQAPTLLANGQGASVLQWLGHFPAGLYQTSPWLLYWGGHCRMAQDPVAARRDFARAYALFREDGTQTGQWLCWAGIAETHLFDWDNLADFDPWIRELEDLGHATGGFPSAEIEARVLSGSVALIFRRPDHPLLQHWAKRALTLLRTRQTQSHTARLANFAGIYHIWRGHTLAVDAVHQAALANAPLLTPLGQVQLGMLALVLANFRGDAAGVEAALQDSLTICRENGLPVLETHLIQNAGMAALTRGDGPRLQALIAQAEPLLAVGSWLESALQMYLQAGLALLHDDLLKARAQANNALMLIRELGMPLLAMHFELFLLHLDVREHRGVDPARLTGLLARAREARSDLFIAASLCTRALIALNQDDEDAAATALGQALALGARWNYGHLFLYADREAESRLCAFALEQDMEPCHVRHLILARALLPPPQADPCWPWPVRVLTLGGFSLVCADQEVCQGGKPRKRPLELLKALVAQGPAGAGSMALARLLWPDASGEGLRKTLEINLHRLRKLLGRDDAVLLHEGHLSLNPRVCWVDLWAFEQAAEQGLSALQTLAADAQVLPTSVFNALKLYAGAFLATDEEAAWLLPTRDRALSRFQRLVAELGRHFEQAGEWARAEDLYRRTLEQDNLNEFFYRRLIFCLQRQDRHAEALLCYRRGRELLSIVLGMAPSPETRDLIRISRSAGASLDDT